MHRIWRSAAKAQSQGRRAPSRPWREPRQGEDSGSPALAVGARSVASGRRWRTREIRPLDGRRRILFCGSRLRCPIGRTRAKPQYVEGRGQKTPGGQGAGGGCGWNGPRTRPWRLNPLEKHRGDLRGRCAVVCVARRDAPVALVRRRCGPSERSPPEDHEHTQGEHERGLKISTSDAST